MADPLSEFYAIAPTAFDELGRVDHGALKENIERIVGFGVHSFLLTGSYGEFQSLTADERIAITTTAVESTSATSVMSGAAALSTRDAAALSSSLYDAGADHVMVSAPFAAELTTDDLLRHFGDLGQANDNLVVYNNPVFGVDLPPALIAEISALGGYVGLKQGTTKLAHLIDSIAILPCIANPITVLAAADLTCAAAVGAGVGGVTSTNVWVFPRAFLAIADPQTEPQARLAIIRALQPYAELVRKLGQPRAVKEAMIKRGYAGVAGVRRPYVELLMAQRSEVALVLRRCDEALAEIGVIEDLAA